MQPYTICLAGGVARNPLVRLAAPASASFPADEHIAIVGPNGSGKKPFGRYAYRKIPFEGRNNNL